MWHVMYFGVVKRTAGRDIDSLRTGRSGDRIPVETRYSAPVQIGFFHGGKSAGGGAGVDHPHQSSAEVKERVELVHHYSPSESSRHVTQ